MTTLLFFDDYYLNRWENLSRHVGRPELVPEATFVDPDHLLASGYPTVFRDDTGKWRCLYQGISGDPRWRNCPETASLHKQLPHLEINPKNAGTCQARSRFLLVSGTQARRFNENGEEPAP